MVAAIERRYASGSAPGAGEARVKSVVPVEYASERMVSVAEPDSV
jgi:hypothetical protein